jgi:hypothetical protein
LKYCEKNEYISYEYREQNNVENSLKPKELEQQAFSKVGKGVISKIAPEIKEEIDKFDLSKKQQEFHESVKKGSGKGQGSIKTNKVMSIGHS